MLFCIIAVLDLVSFCLCFFNAAALVLLPLASLATLLLGCSTFDLLDFALALGVRLAGIGLSSALGLDLSGIGTTLLLGCSTLDLLALSVRLGGLCLSWLL